MNHLFGHTRSVVRRNFALLEPAGFVSSSLVEWKGGAKPYVVISSAMGADFTQTHVRCDTSGSGSGATVETEFFAYITKGKVKITAGGQTQQLSGGGFVYVPPETEWEVKATAGSELVIFTRIYDELDGVEIPQVLFGSSSDVPSQAFMGDSDAQLQVLLPEVPGFDMAVNIFTYQPGATLPMVETHVMEHGLVMLSGQGIYRLEDTWHPVKAGDVIWMGPYCPQWFVAMGKEPASYLYYKDVNRMPL